MTKKLKIKFLRTDSFCRPIFKSLKGKEYFGSVNNLFRDTDEPKKIEEFFENHIDDLLYFGSHFDCEPLGLKPSELKEPVVLEIVKG